MRHTQNLIDKHINYIKDFKEKIKYTKQKKTFKTKIYEKKAWGKKLSNGLYGNLTRCFENTINNICSDNDEKILGRKIRFMNLD